MLGTALADVGPISAPIPIIYQGHLPEQKSKLKFSFFHQKYIGNKISPKLDKFLTHKNFIQLDK